MQKFILKVAFLSALFLAAGYIIPAFKPVGVSLVWVLVVLLYSALTIVLRAWINRVKNASPIKFTTAVSGTTAVKMFSTLWVGTPLVCRLKMQPFKIKPLPPNGPLKI